MKTPALLVGFSQWCVAGVVAPLAGLGGDRTAIPMAVIVLVLVALSLAVLFALTRPVNGRPADRVLATG